MIGGIDAMANIRYRRGWENAADMAVYARMMSTDNGTEIRAVRRHLVTALCEDVTERQREILLLYYDERLNMREIGARFGINASTVSRTIKRGEDRLRRCLRYGAAAFLREDD